MSPKRKSPNSKPSNPIPLELEPDMKKLENSVRAYAQTFIEFEIPVGALAYRLRGAIFDELRKHEEELEVKKPAPVTTAKPGIKKVPAPPESQVDVTAPQRKRGDHTRKMKDAGYGKTA